MFENLLIQPQTRKDLDAFVAKPSHALLLISPAGSGKKTLAKVLAARLLELEDALGLKSYPYFTQLSTPEGKKDIPIEDVRKVRNLMALKVPGSKKVRRLIF